MSKEMDGLMKKNNMIPKPTEAELAILQVLWRLGPSTAREVQREMDKAKTTVLTLLQIMVDKGFVARDDSSYAHVYTAKFSQEKMQKNLLSDMTERLFEGSSYQLVMKALSMKKLSKQELDEIYMLLEKYNE